MRGKIHKHEKRAGTGKVVTGILLGSVVGATVGWLTAPGGGEDIRRWLRRDMKSAHEKAKTAEGNLESQARELAAEVAGLSDPNDTATAPRKRVTPAEG